jgi:hypothetical protein
VPRRVAAAAESDPDRTPRARPVARGSTCPLTARRQSDVLPSAKSFTGGDPMRRREFIMLFGGAARLAARGAGAAAGRCGWLRSAHLTFGHNLRAEWRNSPNRLPPVMAPSKYMMAERIATGALALSPRKEIVTVSRF